MAQDDDTLIPLSIDRFTIDGGASATIDPGDTVDLEWALSGSAAQWAIIRLDYDGMSMVIADGTRQHNATMTRTITPQDSGPISLSVSNPNPDTDDNSTATVAVTVNPPPSGPALSGVTAEPAEIELGDVTWLSWTNARRDVSHVEAYLGDTLAGEADANEGYVEVEPAEVGQFTYRLLAMNEADEPLGEFTATVTVAPARPDWADDDALEGVSANPATITLGESTNLGWRNARPDVQAVEVYLGGEKLGEADPAEGMFAVTPDAAGEFEYTLLARADDGMELGEFTVAVTVKRRTTPPRPPANRAPVAEDDTGPSVKFGGTVTIQAATLLENDTDADGDTLTVTAVSAAQQGKVSLSGTTITFEHDGESDADDGYAFTYTVSDGRSGTDTAAVTGTVAPANRAPTSVTVTWVAPAADGTIREDVDTGAARVKVAELSATDADEDDAHTFTVSGTATFEVDGSALYLKQGVALDHETAPSLTFTVTATDSGGLSVTGDEQILTVADANEAPTAVTVTWVAPVADGAITENLDTRGGRIRVAVLSAVDPDAGDEPAFSLEGADAGSFEVDGSALYLRRGVVLDHDVQPAYTAVVVATDGAGLAARAEALLRVVPETDAVARSRLGRVNEAILPELSRALVSGALEAVERRIDASGGASDNAAGGSSSAETAQRLLWTQGMALQEGRWKQALGTSSFVLNLGGGSAAASGAGGSSGGAGSGLTLWAGGDYRSLSGGDDADAVQWDGDVVSARVGVDKRLREDLLAGLALSWSRGEIDYADRGRAGYLPIEGVHESEMLSVWPYVGWQPRENLSLWGALGFGTGDVTLKDEEAGPQSSDSGQTTAALGARTGLFNSSGLIEGGTTRLDLKGELWTSRFELDDGDLMDGLDTDTSRLRLGLEASHAHRLSGGGTLTPSVELGLRRDGGDGETGGGVEFGGALAWTNPSRGLRVEGFARTLLAHEGEVDEWGAGGLIMYMPDPGGRGLRVSLRPSWGVTGGGLERLWASDSVNRMQGYRRPDGSGRLDAEFGYGLGAAGGLLTPFGGLTVDDAARRYRFGALFELGRSLTLSFEAERRESVFDGVDHGVLLRFRYWPGGKQDGPAAHVRDPRMTGHGLGWNDWTGSDRSRMPDRPMPAGR